MTSEFLTADSTLRPSNMDASLVGVARRAVVYLAVAALLATAFGLMVSSAVRKSSTVDEQTHLLRGTAYLLERATQFRDVHPPLGFAIQSLPLLIEPNLALPTDSPAWAEGRWELAADAFLWQLNDNPQRLVLLGRLSTMWLSLLLGALAFRWGRQLGGLVAAFAALALLLFDPNLIAHGRLMTNDLSVTLYLTTATYAYWRWANTGRWPAVLLFGFALGLAGATKYSAITLVPALGLVGLWLSIRQRSWRPIVVLALGGLIAIGVIWALYGFPLRPVPLAPLWADLSWTLDYFERPAGAYLLGETRAGGWWYYFPVAFLLKTPLATLTLLLWAGVVSVVAIVRYRHPSGLDWLSWLLLVTPPLTYFATSMAGPLNIGYRHLLPILPYVALFVAATLLGNKARHGLWARRIAAVLVISVPALSIFVWPDYIPYFNRLAGNQDQRWQVLSDSNIDWGQDLPGLVAWRNANVGDRPFYASYFGTAHPSAYGLDYSALPTWSPGPEQLPPDRQLFDPASPAPGLYAISVTNLHGHVLDESDLYAAFREQPPLATIGDSIRVYEVAASGPPFNIALAGLTPAELAEALRAKLPGNDRRVRWLLDGDALIWSPDGLMLATTARPVADALRPYLPDALTAQASEQSLYRLEAPPSPSWATRDDQFNGMLTLLGSEVVETSSDELGIVTYWQAHEPTDRPLKLFIHALADDGQLIAQWDGLSVDPASLEPGDRFMQFSMLPMPATQASQLIVGVYDGDTLERLTLPDGRDFTELGAP